MVKIFEINLLLSSLYNLKNNENCVKKEFVKKKYDAIYFIEMSSPYDDVIETASKFSNPTGLFLSFEFESFLCDTPNDILKFLVNLIINDTPREA